MELIERLVGLTLPARSRLSPRFGPKIVRPQERFEIQLRSVPEEELNGRFKNQIGRAARNEAIGTVPVGLREVVQSYASRPCILIRDVCQMRLLLSAAGRNGGCFALARRRYRAINAARLICHAGALLQGVSVSARLAPAQRRVRICRRLARRRSAQGRQP